MDRSGLGTSLSAQSFVHQHHPTRIFWTFFAIYTIFCSQVVPGQTCAYLFFSFSFLCISVISYWPAVGILGLGHGTGLGMERDLTTIIGALLQDFGSTSKSSGPRGPPSASLFFSLSQFMHCYLVSLPFPGLRERSRASQTRPLLTFVLLLRKALPFSVFTLDHLDERQVGSALSERGKRSGQVQKH